MAIRAARVRRWTESIGLRFDARWSPTLAPKGAHFFCDESGSGDCFSRDPQSTLARYFPFVNHIEITTGLMFRY